jgi:aminopeptidase
MSSEFEKNLDKYSDLILKVGLSLQKGQRLLIGVSNPINRGIPLELSSFVRLITRKAYQLGARYVELLWDDPQLRLIRFQNAPRDSFEEFPTWRTDAELEFAEKGDALLAIAVQNPELYIEQDLELVTTEESSFSKHSEPFNRLISKNTTNWLVIAAPVNGWTEKVIPDLPQNESKAKLWDIIFDICRVKQEDPVRAWNDHIRQLIARRNYLNDKQYTELKFKAPGTDLLIGLPKLHIWHGGSVISQKGINFTPNIPTEEIFTLPHRNRAEGVVTTTKPHSYGGNLIEEASFILSKGEVIDATAKTGEQYLLELLKRDEGSSRIGEVSLVANSSPISQTGLLFYNILFDENASSHIAFGRAYRFCLKNSKTMSDEEFMAAGGNISLIHRDFMIGSEKMDVDGILEDGTLEPIMRSGEWAFKV